MIKKLIFINESSKERNLIVRVFFIEIEIEIERIIQNFMIIFLFLLFNQYLIIIV